MKWLYIVLSFYVVSLTVFPCADEAGIVYDSISAISGHDAEHEDGCEDKCSPFCSCACCGASFNVYIRHSELATPNIYSPAKINMWYLQHVQSGFFGAIWQPPKTEI